MSIDITNEVRLEDGQTTPILPETDIRAATSLLRFPIDASAAQQSSGSVLPAGAVIVSASLDVTAPFPPGTTITLGSLALPTLLMATGDSAPAIANLYAAEQDTVWPTAARVLATLAGGFIGLGGAAEVVVVFSPAPLS